MRVHRANYHSDAELASELQWTAALNAAGIRAPQVRSLPDGRLFTTLAVLEVPEPRQIDLLEWFEGEPLAPLDRNSVGLGKECVSQSRFRGSPSYKNKKKK